MREGATQVPYSFRNNETTGYPDASASVNSRKRLQRLDASQNPTTSSTPAYFRLFNQAGGSTLISTSTKKAISYTTAKGRVLTLDSAAVGMEFIYDDAGSIRQVKNNADGLVDVVIITGTKYQIRFYLPSQIGAKTNNLYTVSGEPYKYYEVYLPDEANTRDIRIKKVAGSTESESKFVYNDSLKDWTLVKHFGSAEAVRIAKSKTVNGVLTTELEQTYNAANELLSEKTSIMEKTNFGNLLKESYSGPVSYGLKTSYEYYTAANATTVGLYGKVKSIGSVTNFL